MKRAKITDKTKFAQRIKEEFLKGPWDEDFITTYEEPANFKKLWWGQTKYLVLGNASMTALKNTRNAMGKRIVDTTGNEIIVMYHWNNLWCQRLTLQLFGKCIMQLARFIENNEGSDGTGNQIKKDIYNAVNSGRTEDEAFRKCMDLFGSFCTKKETNSTLTQKTQMNLAGKSYQDCVNEIHKELEGCLLQEKISSARMAFIYLHIYNNMRVMTDPDEPDNRDKITYQFKPKPEFLKFTSPVQRNLSGGWNEDGMRKYMKFFEREKEERKLYDDPEFYEKEKRCDYFCGPKEDESVDDDDNGDDDSDDDADDQLEYEDEFNAVDSFQQNPV